MQLEIYSPNEEGEAYATLKWMAETPNGWVGAFDRKALEQLMPRPDDRQVADLVNRLHDIAIEFHATDQLRERIAREVVPFVKGGQ